MNQSALNKQFELLQNATQGILGLSALHIETNNLIEFNADKQFLMCSTYKVAIATYLFHQVEQGKINLNTLCEVRAEDFLPGMYSSLNQLNYAVPQQLSLHSLLQLMLQESCNTSTKIILNALGGTEAVHAFLVTHNLGDIQNDYYTVEEFGAWEGLTNLPKNCSLQQFATLAAKVSAEDLKIARQKAKAEIDSTGIGTTTPRAMTELLKKIFKAEIISKDHAELLFSIMRRCKTGPARIMGLLPPRTPVAHKTGSLTSYTCDIGLMTLPSSAGHIAISIYNKDALVSLEKAERVLAEVSRTIYDVFLFA